MITDRDVWEELTRAAEGLVFMSESDEPLAVVAWEEAPRITPEWLRRLARADASAPVEETSVREFFRVAAGEQEWKGEEERRTARRYQALVRFLEERLAGARVYRIGERNIVVYVLGLTPSGNLLGLRTRVVET